MKNHFLCEGLKTLIFLLLSSSISFGQIDPFENGTIIHLNELISLNESENPSLVNSVKELSQGSVPSIFLKEGNINLTDPNKTPLRIITDAESISSLYISNQLFSQVEMIIIQINESSDLTLEVNLASLSQFTSLKYLYFLSSINLCGNQPNNSDCEKTALNNVLNGSTLSPILVAYTSEVSE